MTTSLKPETLELSVKNFGPIVEAEIDLRPLTVFVGPSNTGKSYLATLIYALHKVFGANPDSTGLIRRKKSRFLQTGNEEVEFPADATERLLEWARTLKRSGPAVRGSGNSSIEVPESVAVFLRPLFTNSNRLGPVLVEEMGRCFGIAEASRLIRHGSRHGMKVAVRHRIQKESNSPESFEHVLIVKGQSTEFQSFIPNNMTLRVEEMGEMRLSYDWNREWTRQPILDEDQVRFLTKETIAYLVDDIVTRSVGWLGHAAHYLPADRTGIMHTHKAVVGSLIGRASRAGQYQENTPQVLTGIITDFLEALMRLEERIWPKGLAGTRTELADRLETDLLGGVIHSVNSVSGYPEFYYQPDGWRDRLPLMNVSSMVSELAPVALYLRHVVRPGNLFIIEEPESHLHPGMQVEFVRQLARVIRSGIHVILTTHSEWVLDELTNLALLDQLPESRREGMAGADCTLSSDEVGVWLFEPKQRPRGAVVKEVPFDVEFGGFRSGFDDVAVGTYNDYAEIFNRMEKMSK